MESSGENDQTAPFQLPSEEALAQLSLDVHRELHGGKQSRVLEATDRVTKQRLAVKVTGSAETDQHQRTETSERLRVRTQAANRNSSVVPITPVAGNEVNRIGHFEVVASPMIQGRSPDITSQEDVEQMGLALAGLHETLRLCDADLPLVAALHVVDGLDTPDRDHQLLHGDFSPANLVIDEQGQIRILDFDDCGFGPVEFELGNTLFMVLFDTSQSLDQPSERFEHFRTWFVDSYCRATERGDSGLLVDAALRARADALRYWLSHLDEAPPGIRHAAPTWHNHLRAFSGLEPEPLS